MLGRPGLALNTGEINTVEYANLPLLRNWPERRNGGRDDRSSLEVPQIFSGGMIGIGRQSHDFYNRTCAAAWRSAPQ
jgi:hypothetical protein